MKVVVEKCINKHSECRVERWLWLDEWLVVLMETHKSGLLHTARGLICSSGWAAVQCTGTSHHAGQGKCERGKAGIWKNQDCAPIELDIRIFSLLSHSNSSSFLFFIFPKPLYSCPCLPLFRLLFCASVASPSLISTAPSPLNAVAQCDRWSWISVICFIFKNLTHCRPKRLSLK